MENNALMRKNLRESKTFTRLAEQVIRNAAHFPLDFYPSPGNWGDSLINAGTRQLFTDHDIATRELSRFEIENIDRTESAKNLAVVGGGGGWNRNWDSTVSFVAKLSTMYNLVVVLPSSYDLNLVSHLNRSNIYLYTRSDDSLNEVDNFCHDMAFYCRLPEPKEPEIQYPLIAFRRDKERSVRALNPDRNWDVSLLGTAKTSYLEFMGLIDRFPAITTDRLHVAIAGAMLGKQVELLDGNYGKNSGVFRASLCRNFDNVSLMSWAEIQDKSFTGMTPIGVSGYFEEL